MTKLTDGELLDELRKRFEENTRALDEIRAMTRRLEDLNEKLIASEQLKGNFLSNIRNEINNPLAAIIALAETLQSSVDLDPEKVASVASLIHQGAVDLDFQLRTIFTAADMEAGACVPGVKNVDVGALLRESIEYLAYKAREKGVDVEFDPASGERLRIQTDGDMLQLAVSNLLANAIEFGQEGGRVVVTVRSAEDKLSIAVQDFGIGIDESDQEKIFDRFVQLDTGSTRLHGGHGLGLSVAKSLIELLDGSIAVRSAKGRGSTFTVTIPMKMTEEPVEDFIEDGCEFFGEPVEEF